MNTEHGKISLFSSFAVIILLLIFGCDNAKKTTTKQQQPAPAAIVKSAAFPQYKATLAEGIDFKNEGFPTFIANVTGMSGYEPWGGRWTDGNRAVFSFREPLPKKFTLVLKAQSFGPNALEPTKIKVGPVEKEITIGSTPQTYRLPFVCNEKMYVIEFIIPKPASPAELKIPGNNDIRKLGIALFLLKIEA